MALGVSPISNDLNRSAMQYQASMLEQLGNQVRQDVRTVQTNRQLAGFAQQVQSVDPTAPDYAQKISSVMAQFPLAAQSPLGAAAINQLGAQRNFYQQQFMADKNFDRQIGLLSAGELIKNQDYGAPPLTHRQIKDAANGVTPPDLPTQGRPSIPAQPFQGQPGMAVDQAIPNSQSEIAGTANALAMTGNPMAATMAGQFGYNHATPAQAAAPTSVLNNVGAQTAVDRAAQVAAFTQTLKKLPPNQRLSKPEAERLIDGFRSDLARGGTGALFKQALNDGSGVVFTNPDGTTRVSKYPEGVRAYVPGGAKATDDPALTRLLKKRDTIDSELREVKGAEQANVGAFKAIPGDDDVERLKVQKAILGAAKNAKYLEEELAKVSAEIAAREAQLIPSELTEPSNKKRAGTTAGVDMANAKALAKKALDDPNTAPEYKEAARIILSQ